MTIIKPEQEFDMRKSKGHVMFTQVYEYFIHEEQGDLYRAPLCNPVMRDGYRGGARWEAPAHMAAEWLNSVPMV